MAFCNSCGTQLDPSAKFCAKCGAAAPLSGFHQAAGSAPVAPAPSTPTPAQAAPQGGNALKVVLIVVAILVGLGILGAATAGFIAWRVARNVRMHTDEKNVKVETPFGTVQSTDNADEAARNLGVDLYPGAKALKGQAASVTMGNMHSVSAEFETDDAAGKVADFYNKQFPNATVSSQGEDQYAIVSVSDKGMITINVDTEDGKTRIKIANVTGKPFGKPGGPS